MGKAKGKEKSQPGYFLVSAREFERIYTNGGGPDAMAAYLVLNSGVNRHQELRCCTHGANSVAKRTGLGTRKAENAIGWLLEREFIRKPSAGEPSRVGKGAGASVRWIIAVGDEDGEVAICRQFTDGARDGCKTPLERLLANIAAGGESPRSQAIADALVLYVAILREQDFGDWAGVRPLVWSEPLKPAVPRSDCLDRPIEPLDDSGLVLVRAMGGGDECSDVDFIRATIGPDAESDEESERRFWHAMSELRRVHLIYRVVVIWWGDPTDPCIEQDARPIATLYVNDSWARSCEPHVQFELDRALNRLQGEDREFDFDGRLIFQESDGYRYVVKAGQEGKTTLVGQLRARYWAATPAMVKGRSKEKERTEQWQASLEVCGRSSTV